MLLMGKSTISMAIFHCYVGSPEGNQKVSQETMVFWTLAPGDTRFLQAMEINHEPPVDTVAAFFAEFVAIANNKTGWWILFLWNYICIHIDIIHNIYI